MKHSICIGLLLLWPGLASAEVPIGLDLLTPRPSGVESSCLATGDFNEDGLPDVAVGNWGDHTVTLFLGSAEDSFEEVAPRFETLGTNPVAILSHDLDGDGHLDLAVLHFWTNTLAILLGDGAGSFDHAPESPFAVGENPRGMDVGDLDEDGVPDLAVTSRLNDDIRILLGGGDGTFDPAPDSPVDLKHCAGPVGVRLGRFDGDDHLDLAAICSDSGDLAICLGDGKGAFVQDERNAIDVGRHPKYLVASYLNVEDTWLDLALVTQGADLVRVLLGDGAGWFEEEAGSPYFVGTTPRGLTVGDLNRDGRQDLITANTGGVDLTILEGDGRGRFRWMGDPYLDGEPMQTALLDVDEDGRPDIVGAAWTDGVLATLRNTTPRALEDLMVAETPDGTRVDFGLVEGASSYDLVRGKVEALREMVPRVELDELLCLENDSPDASSLGDEDQGLPMAGRAFFYLVRYYDGATGSYGPSTGGFERVPGSGDCPD
jgi:hypothetical protein